MSHPVQAHACDFCNKTFARKWNAQRHEQKDCWHVAGCSTCQRFIPSIGPEPDTGYWEAPWCNLPDDHWSVKVEHHIDIMTEKAEDIDSRDLSSGKRHHCQHHLPKEPANATT